MQDAQLLVILEMFDQILVVPHPITVEVRNLKVPVNYLIADTLFQVNLLYDPFHHYKKFTEDLVTNNKRLDIHFENGEFFNREYVHLDENLQWYQNSDDQLCLKIIDREKKVVAGIMVLQDDYSAATVTYRQSDTQYDLRFMDLFMYNFFQVNLLFTPGIVLHAAAINWKDQGILFSAQSETGKSTQARLWCDQEDAEIINGDRPAITIRNDGFYVHGTPWSGSDAIIKNISKPIKAIVMLEQSKENVVERLSPEEAVNLLLPRVFMPYFNEGLTTRALGIVDQIIQKVPIYKLKCRPDVGAVEVLKRELSLLPE